MDPKEKKLTIMKKFAESRRIYKERDGAGWNDTNLPRMWFYYQQGIPLYSLHCSMFMRSLQQFCNEEQYKHWVPLARNLNVVGCYA